MRNNTNRALLLAVVGGYVLYLAYDLLQNLLSGNRGSMSVPVFILAITFFTVSGIAVLIYAWKVWKGPAEKDPVVIGDEEEKAEESEEKPGAAEPEKQDKT